MESYAVLNKFLQWQCDAVGKQKSEAMRVDNNSARVGRRPTSQTLSSVCQVGTLRQQLCYHVQHGDRGFVRCVLICEGTPATSN